MPRHGRGRRGLGPSRSDAPDLPQRPAADRLGPGDGTRPFADDDRWSDDGLLDDELLDGPSRRAPRPRRTLRVIGEYAGLALLAIVLSSLLKAFVGLAFYIPSGSMEPTLQINDRVVVSRLSYKLGEPGRGDVIVFQNPDWVAPPKPNLAVRMAREVLEVVGAQQPREKNLIKRIVGLPGDRFALREGKVWIDGKALDEPWLEPGTETVIAADERDNLRAEVTIPAGHYVVLGDNRGNSCDSRCFTSGPLVKRSSIVGRAFVKIWPVWNLTWL